MTNRILHGIEVRRGLRAGGMDVALAHPPVFIVGAPRSGSTLLYQLMTDRFDLAYVANAHARWPGGPSVVERRRHLLRDRSERADYSSAYGATRGDLGPSECGEFWYRFFARSPHYAPAGSLDAPTLAAVRAAVREFGDAAGRPVLYKNLFATVRMRPLAEALPEAVFVWITRDLVANAHSLLEGRMRNRGSYDEWFSVEPPHVADLRGLPPEQQVVAQVRELDQLVRKDMAEIGAERCHHVDYAELCAQPRATLDVIASFLGGLGVHVATRTEVPESFPQGGGTVRIDPELYERLSDYVERSGAPA
jgi:hypothetical protein